MIIYVYKTNSFRNFAHLNTKLPDIQYKTAHVFPLNYYTSAVFEYGRFIVFSYR